MRVIVVASELCDGFNVRPDSLPSGRGRTGKESDSLITGQRRQASMRAVLPMDCLAMTFAWWPEGLQPDPVR